MSETQEPHSVGTSVGRHRLGPHVVGQRVVVRRLVRGETGPSGGPALTDLLGVCESFADGVIVVRPETGAAVAVPLADVVSGKPVPPRASVRDRVPAREAQVRGFALFPDLRTRALGDWVLRDSATSTARRANSVLAFGPSGLGGEDEAEAVAAVLAHYDRPVAAVLADSAEATLLGRLGWVAESHEADTLFQVAGLAQVARALRAVDDTEVTLTEDHGTEDHSTDGTGAVVTARIGERACGVAAYADDWVGFRSIEVAPAHRRRGLALAVMAALVGWGAERGATTAYLQVLGDNEPALDLYAGLGFRTHHRYRYMTPSTRS